ncbi:hypothetical protein BDN71DRAFT_1240962 [Pleurotus eryngii]|uniref:Uncharacterized protein n=1 Tax=Pleurotus eryngii TaxID=5323 RepID=A0A9P5ZUJ9_PLEER|nr:hypothetical protein BDN71DRAFT_1240962 [Pleurotus eryngii]
MCLLEAQSNATQLLVHLDIVRQSAAYFNIYLYAYIYIYSSSFHACLFSTMSSHFLTYIPTDLYLSLLSLMM